MRVSMLSTRSKKNRRNYCKIRILSEDPEHKDLKLDEE